MALWAAPALLSPVLFPPTTLNGQESNAPETSSPQVIVLNPQQIVITLGSDFGLPTRPTSIDRGVKIIEEQIEKKRAADLEKASTQGAFWGARFWDYLPKSTSGSLNSPVTGKDDDDPFTTPSYLMLATRILDRQLAESEARSRLFFSK